MTTSEDYRKIFGIGDVYRVKQLLADGGFDPSYDNNWAIKSSSKDGYLDIVKLLLKDKRVDPSVDDNYPIGMASARGHIKIVELLLKDKRVDPSDWDNWAILRANDNNYLDIVRLLLQDERVKIRDIKNSKMIMYPNGLKTIIKINRELKLKKLLQHDDVV